MTPIDKLSNDSADPLSFGSLAEEAKQFLLSQRWCKEIVSGYLDIGWEGILAVFLFEFKPLHPEIDDSVWIIVGDIPPAYICNDNLNGPSALEGYVAEMRKWVNAVKSGDSVLDLIPVNTPSTLEYAQMLDTRLNFITQKLLSRHTHLLDRRSLIDGDSERGRN